MKYAILVAALVVTVFFGACNKSDFSGQQPATITLHENGYDYTMRSTTPASNQDVINVTMQKSASSSHLTINAYNTSSNRQFSLMLNAFGAYTAAGTFKQSVIASPGDQLVEYFTNGQTYTIDSATVVLSNSTDYYIAGSFTLWLSNSAGHTISYGSFSTNNPTIQ